MNLYKYYGSVFKVALPDEWAFVVSGPELVDQIRRWREDELSLAEVSNEVRLRQSDWWAMNHRVHKWSIEIPATTHRRFQGNLRSIPYRHAEE